MFDHILPAFQRLRRQSQPVGQVGGRGWVAVAQPLVDAQRRL